MMEAEYLSEEFKEYCESVSEKNIENIRQEVELLRNEKRFSIYNPDQCCLIDFNPAELFPKRCFERFLVETIKGLDISDFSYTHNKDNGGKTEYNPRSLLGLIFYGIADGLFSSRKLETACLYDSRYVFVSGGATPDHSTISRFINRYDKAILNLFSQVLYICWNMKYLDYELIATDGSKFKAYASSKFTGTLKHFKSRKEKLSKKIEIALNKLKSCDVKEDLKAIWTKKKESYETEYKKVSDFLDNAKENYKSKGKEMEQNITDNDCRKMKIKNNYTEGYNAQVSVCAKNGIIVASDVSNQQNDINQFQPQVERVFDEAPKGVNLLKSTFVADNGYNSIDNLIYSDKKDINVLISDSRDKYIYIDKDGDMRKGKNITIDDCQIKNIGEDIVVSCPGKQQLTQKNPEKMDGEKYLVFRAENIEHCKTCQFFEQCRSNLKGHKQFKIKKKIADNRDLIDSMYENLRTDEGRAKYGMRMQTVEKVFGHIKSNLGFNCFFVRGLNKVRVRWEMICMVYNLRRIYNIEFAANL